MSDLIERQAVKERTEKRTETRACDTIYRQAAVDALDCINGAEEVLRSLPPAQPEHDGFYEFLFNVINPNDMEKYIAMYHSKGVKSNE